MGLSSVSSWNEPGIFSSDFNSYKLSADIYFPLSIFNKETDGSVFIDPQIQFWFGDLEVNGYLEREYTLRIGFDYEKNCPFWNGIGPNDTEIPNPPCIKDAKVIGDMVKVEIVDATVNPTFKTQEWDETTGLNKEWTDPIPATGDVVPQIRFTTDRPYNGKFVVTNASVKIGDKEYKTDYTKSGPIAGFTGEIDGDYTEFEATTFNTSALTVAKTSVKVKKKKSATVKVTTMFSGDKVSVSSSSSKVAKATYKSGKVTIKGVKKGKATVSVKANGKTQKIKVTVK
ncbi:MAG: hypothetical protein II699_00600 [Lachnospiraceae bacterium]|nr:hypothetical protein [Lachnospiraceae bacterium]